MQLNKNQVIEIDLKDLFFHILYRWRSILAVALIGAVVLCGYQYLTLKSTHDAGKVTKEERQYQLDVQQYADNIEKNQNIVRVNTKLLQGQNTYQRESIYFQLDPQRVWRAKKNYLVKVDQSVLDKLPQGSVIDPADSILSAYASPLSEATDDELKEVFGTDKPEYVSELVETLARVEDNTITVSVSGASKEAALAGLALLDTKMEAIAEGKAQEIDKHTLTAVSESVNQGPDSLLLEKQGVVAETVTKLQEALQKARQDLDELEAKGEPQKPGTHLVRNAVIGFILGAFLLAFVYAVHFIFRGRLNHSRDLAERYNLPIFGERMTSGQIHANKGLDKLFSRWELGKNTINDEVVYNNIAALIEEKTEAQKIVLVSTLPAEKLVCVKDALSKRLSGKVVEVQADALQNSMAITEAAKADAVMITEEKRVSRLKDMDRMAESLMISEAKVIGAIVL